MRNNILGFVLLAAPAALFADAAGSDLGKAEARCRAGEQGPAFLVNVTGIRDNSGLIKVELYPSNDQDFLSDDSKLLAAGKVFRRAEVPAPANHAVQICMRVPRAGAYSIIVLHDANSNHRFDKLSRDGIGLGGNTKIPLRQPHASETRVMAGDGLTPIRIVMNYYNGLFSYRPIKV